MRTSLKLFCMFALFGAIVSAQTNLNFAFKDTTFYVQPKAVLNASNVPNGGVLSSSTVLLPGPISGTNMLLSVYEQNGRFTFFRQQLSVFNGQVMQSFEPIVTSMPLNDVKYTATLDGYLAFCSVEPDEYNFIQVFIYKMLLNGTKIERMAVTNNKDRTRVYRTLSLFNDNVNIAFAFVEGILDNKNVFQPNKILMNKLGILDNSVGYEFPIGSGGADFASCDSMPYTSTAYCIFKQDKSTRGAIISLTNSFSQDPVNIWTDSDTISYSPLYAAAVNGYYVVFASAKSNNQISLVASIVASSYGPRTINRWTLSNDFVSFSISSVIPYYNGFAIFYSTTDAANNQFWYYEAFSSSFDVAVSSTLIATVPSNYLFSSFTVAPSSTGGTPSDAYFDNNYRPVNTDFGNPIGLLAIQSTGTQTISAWYGQILKQTYSDTITLAGSVISSLLMLVSFILGLILVC